MSSTAAATSPLSLDALPQPLLARCIEYTAPPDDPQLHFYRHLDLPAVYRQATYLWSELEQSSLQKAFPPGWLHDPTHPFQLCSGQVRLLSRPRRSSAAGQAAKAIEKAFGGEESIIDETLMMARSGSRDRPFIMSDVSPYCTLDSSACFLWLHGGPQLFQPFNLLAATPSTQAAHDHSLAQINIGKRGTHTNTHTDWYGADGAGQLMEGEKLWIMAPPHHSAAFEQLFPATQHFDLSADDPSVVKRFEELYSLSGSCAVHQRAGDIIYVPGGWPHAVINLTDAVSIGWSYLRPWKLKGCLAWARESGEEKALSVVDLAAVFEKTLSTAVSPSIVSPSNPSRELTFWGLSPAMLQELRSAWFGLKQTWRTGKLDREAQRAYAATLTQLSHTPIQPPFASPSPKKK